MDSNTAIPTTQKTIDDMLFDAIQKAKTSTSVLAEKNRQLDRKLTDTQELIVRMTVNNIENVRMLKESTGVQINSLRVNLHNAKKEIADLRATISKLKELADIDNEISPLWLVVVIIAFAVTIGWQMNLEAVKNMV
jgi:carbonic anhydrase